MKPPNLTQSTRITIRKQLLHSITKFIGFSIILLGSWFLILIEMHNLFDGFNGSFWIFFIITGIGVMWVWIKKITPFLTDNNNDHVDVFNSVMRFAELDALDNFSSNKTIHNQIHKIGKISYLMTLDRIWRIKKLNIKFFQGLMLITEIWLSIFMIAQKIQPIYQLIEYEEWILLIAIMIHIGWVWFLFRKNKELAHIATLSELVDEYYD